MTFFSFKCYKPTAVCSSSTDTSLILLIAVILLYCNSHLEAYISNHACAGSQDILGFLHWLIRRNVLICMKSLQICSSLWPSSVIRFSSTLLHHSMEKNSCQTALKTWWIITCKGSDCLTCARCSHQSLLNMWIIWSLVYQTEALKGSR